MRSFTDTQGREWNLSITVRTVKDVREATGILITELYDDGSALLAKLSRDVVLLVDILWVVCRKQADAIGITDEEFGESLGGDALGNAAEAFARAMTDFFSSPEQRKALHLMLDKMFETAQKVAQRAETELTKVDTDSLVQTYIDSALSSQASRDASPGNTHLVNST